MTSSTSATVIPETVSRPLSATAARSLSKLIDNDFALLGQEIQTQAEAYVAAEKKKASDSFDRKTESVQAFEARYTKLANTFLNAANALEQEARMAGLEMELPYEVRNGRHGKVKVCNPGLDRAISAAESAARLKTRQAGLLLERNRLSVQRKVLLASVTSDAEALLTEIPSARELMESAFADPANPMLTVG